MRVSALSKCSLEPLRYGLLSLVTDMQRREFITLLGGVAATLDPIAAWAQETGRKYRIGVLSFLSREATTIVATIDELRSFGFIERQNLVVDERGYGRRADEFLSIAMQLAESRVDAIVTSGAPAIRAAQAATRTIPIIGIADDMVLEGHVRSLANHGGNTTGLSILASDLDGKRLEILMELLPSARRIAVLADSSVQTPAELQAHPDSWHAPGVDLSIHRIVTSEGIAPGAGHRQGRWRPSHQRPGESALEWQQPNDFRESNRPTPAHYFSVARRHQGRCAPGVWSQPDPDLPAIGEIAWEGAARRGPGRASR